ncbi:MAG: sigma-70 family RNA polymerase sigma factor [Bacteroidaceae bacterium]|nr:sigma-70 family RNA polymerase sigma factor [Bacteroidaceae bacterium]
MKRTEEYTDEQIVNGILSDDRLMIEHFFYRKCKPMFAYIIQAIFEFQIDEHTLISELYIYLQANDWYKVRQFDYRSRLTTWISVVSIRYFQKKRNELIDSGFLEDINKKKDIGFTPNVHIDRRIDILKAMDKMPNARYRRVIQMLDLKEVRPELLAEEMGITVDNLYNIHRRALLQLRMVMGRKEDYV